MFDFKFIYFIIFTLNLYKSNGQISDKRLCVDEKCQEPVSIAKTIIRYASPDPRILSFPPNVDIKIFSKEAGSRADLWGAEINGKRGYVPVRMVREIKVLKTPTILVDTELKDSSEVPSVKHIVQPDTVKEPYEVIDGTTLYNVKSVQHSSSEIPDHTTEIPNYSEDEKASGNSRVGGMLSSIENWIKEGLESVVEDDKGDNDDNDFEIDDENQIDMQEEMIKNSEDNQNRESHTVKAKKQMQTKEPLVNIQNKFSANDAKPELPDPISEKDRFNENNQPAEVISHKMDTIDKLVQQTEETELINRDNSIEIIKEQTKNLVGNENTEVTTPSFFPDDIPSSSIFVEAITQNPLENLNDYKQSSIPLNNDKNAEAFSTHTIQQSRNKEANVFVESSGMKTGSIGKTEEANIAPQEQSTEPSQNLEMSKQLSTSIEQSEDLKKTEKEYSGSQDQPIKVKIDNSEISKDILPSDPPQGQLKPPQELQDIEELPQVSSLGGLFSAFKSSQEVNNEVQGSDLDASVGKNDIQTNNLGSDTLETSQIQKETEVPGSSVKTSESDMNILGTKHLPSDNNISKELGIQKSLSMEGNVDNIDADTSKTKDNETDSKIADDLSGVDLSQKILNEKEIPKDKNDIGQIDITGMQEDDEKQNENNYTTENLEVPHHEKVMDVMKMSDDKTEQEILTLQDEAKEDSVISEVHSSGTVTEGSDGFFSSFISWFGAADSKKETQLETYSHPQSKAEEILENVWVNQAHEESNLEHCDANSQSYFNFHSDMFLYLVTSAVSCIMFLFIYMTFDRSKKEAPLIARINKLEKELLVALKENEMLQDKHGAIEVPEEVLEGFKHQLSEVQAAKDHLQLQVMELEIQIKKKDEQIEGLEKEIETSTEVGMELNRIISEMLDPTNGNDRLKENFDQLQRQLLEQKDTISRMTQSLSIQEAENTQLQSELEASQKFASETQEQLNKLLEKLMQLEKEKDNQCSVLQGQMSALQMKVKESVIREEEFTKEIQILKVQLSDAQRQFELKTKEYTVLKENVNSIKSLKQGDNLQTLFDSTATRAQLEQLMTENERFSVQLQQEQTSKANAEKKLRSALEEIGDLQQKYDLADKEKTEVNMKLEVLNNYFKKRENELQEDVIKYKSIFDAKKGEATSTTERIKLMQEEIENYKLQNEMLKQEILSQEIDLKSQISLLEKKVHENWLMARQTERKLEEARQEAAQLRNRLTLREIAINEERIQNRLQSPVAIDHHHPGHHQQNGDALSPDPLTMSPPPPLFGASSAASPPLPGGGLPHPPFLPPPFMPPPPMPFMPPPPPPGPPGDRRPPPLGRMSSPPPPINSRYSPDTSAFSPYERYSPSPPYDSEYGASPPPLRAYSPFTRDERRDPTPGKRAQHNRSSNRRMKGGVTSSGSEHSNDSVDKINRKQTKMV